MHTSLLIILMTEYFTLITDVYIKVINTSLVLKILHVIMFIYLKLLSIWKRKK